MEQMLMIFPCPFSIIPGYNCLGNDERSVQVYIDNFAEFICLHLKHRLSHDDSGIVYKDIDHFRLPL